MSIHYSPPHVVHEAYARACVGPKGNPQGLWVKMSNDVYVIERRLSDTEMEDLEEINVTIPHNGSARRVSVKDIYKPVWFGELLKSMPGWQDIVGEAPTEAAEPLAWWLRVDLVEASERIRFPMLPAKVNMMEWRDMGELRELYSYDGFGFTLRDKEWGRE